MSAGFWSWVLWFGIIIISYLVFWRSVLYVMVVKLVLGKSKSELHYDRQPVGRSVLVSGTHSSGTRDQFFPFSLWSFLDSCGFVGVGRPLWREDGSVICSAMMQVQCQVILWPTVCQPVHLGAGPPVGPMTRF
jgi:hypothetical protein